MKILITVAVLAVLGILCGVLISIISTIMAVKKNETAEKIEAVLPGANCGGCGFSGCAGYAQALADGTTSDCALCSAGGADVAKQIGEITGGSGEFIPRTAVVRCRGSWDVTSMKMEYRGLNNCYAANQLYSGLGACRFGCIGFGDCASVCENDAISVTNGVAKIDMNKCGACGKCVKACPKGLITLVPSKGEDRTVLCLNRSKGAATRKVCTVGCIGCMRCVKECEHDAIKVESFLATIDYVKCIGCGKCETVCPQNCIAVCDGIACVKSAQ